MNRWNRVFVASTFVFSLLGSATHVLAEGSHPPHWEYIGKEGPEHWGEIDPQFEKCKTGHNQSPIDITSAKPEKLSPIQFDYKAAPVALINNGHTIQVNVPKGNTITVNGKKYELLQFHFHSPSEHKISGKSGEMEVHLVHKSAEGELAVVGVFINSGKENGVVKTLWENLPAEVGKEKPLAQANINPADFLPAKRTYSNYPGSLTTPPCSEGVNWLVMKDSIEVSKPQVEKFTSIFPMTARPVQPLHERTVKAAE
ncbi:MAG: carbonic anhydrase family protein [Nitrospirae bacterium]|nr:carbonic anhydrase family protein [Candidatus Manganitrophaceae bacterium]